VVQISPQPIATDVLLPVQPVGVSPMITQSGIIQNQAVQTTGMI
jgi:hypothetical protein